jgi:predicted nucleic acid-binding protein
LLLACKRLGHIDLIAPIIDTLRQHNYLLSDALVSGVLVSAGESNAL